MTDPATKPCLCGCALVLTAGISCKPYRWKSQRFATRACALRWRNLNDPTVIEGRRKGAKSPKRREQLAEQDDPQLCTPTSWLDLPPIRLRLQRQAQGLDT